MGAQLTKEQETLHFGYYIVQDALVDVIKEKEDAGGHSPSSDTITLVTSTPTHLLSGTSANASGSARTAINFRRSQSDSHAGHAPASSPGTSSMPLAPQRYLHSDSHAGEHPSHPSGTDPQLLAANNWVDGVPADLLSDEDDFYDEDHDRDHFDLDEDVINDTRNDIYEAYMPSTSPDNYESIMDGQPQDGSSIGITACQQRPTEHTAGHVSRKSTATSDIDAPSLTVAVTADECTLSPRKQPGKTLSHLRPLTFEQLPTSGALVGLCGMRLRKLSPNIGMLSGLVCLQLCCNQLRTLPAEIGHLTSLRTLDLSGNQLRHLPETIGHLTQLTALRASRNQLQELPHSIGRLERLERLAMDRNRLCELPAEIGQLKRLNWMDVRWNTELNALPAELMRLAFLRRLRTTGCPLQRRRISHRERAANDDYLLSFEPIILVGGSAAPSPLPESTARPANTQPLPAGGVAAAGVPDDIPPPPLPCDPSGVPSLRELAARVIVRNQLPLPPIPAALRRYISSAQHCTECNGPFFEHVHRRRRLVMKQYREIWLEYRLCSAHWSTERERIASLFGELPETAMTSALPGYAKSTTSSSSRHSGIFGTLRLTSSRLSRNNDAAMTANMTTGSGRARANTLRSLATRTLLRRSAASDQAQQTETAFSGTVPLASLFAPPCPPALPLPGQSPCTDTGRAASTERCSPAPRTSTRVARGRANTRPSALSMVGLFGSTPGPSATLDTGLTVFTLDSMDPVNGAHILRTAELDVSSDAAVSEACQHRASIGLLHSTPRSRETAPQRLPTSPGTESLLSAHDAEDNTADLLAVRQASSDILSVPSAALLVASPSASSLLSGYEQNDGTLLADDIPSGVLETMRSSATVGHKSTLVGSLQRRLGAASRASARSLRRSFVGDQSR